MALKKDWISRDEDFVHRGGLASGWDEESDSTTDYVLRNFTKPKTSEAEIREINKLCANRCDILAGDKKVVFSLNPGEKTARTDGKRVIVGTSVLTEPKSFSEKADIMVGLTTHEMAHVLFSNFKQLSSVKDKFHKSILNVLEDERIEHLLTDEFRGYAHNLAKTKKYFLEEKYLVEKALEEGKLETMVLTEEQKKAMQLFDLFFKFVRYPKNMDEDALAENETEIDDIKAILTPYPMTPKDLFKASEEIYEILSKSIKKKMEEGEGEGDEDGESGEESSEATKGKSKSSSKGEPGGSKGSSGTDPGGSETDPEEEKKEDEEDEEEEKEPEKTPEEKAEEIKEVLGEMMADFDSDNEPGKDVETSPAVTKIKFNEEFIHDAEWKATFRTGTPDKTRYDKLLSGVKGDAKRLAASLFTKVFNETKHLRGMRSGHLDEAKIIEAAHGVKTVHMQTIPKETRKLNITILIDESGSMGGQGGDKVDNAASAAILIEKAFEVFPVGQLFIYGFTGDHTWKGTHDHNQILRYREPGMKVKHGLGDVKGRANNRDGECIRAVARRVRGFTKDPMLFFIISDGQPSAVGYGGYDDTRLAVTQVTKMGFFPIQIGIGGGLRPAEQARMFDEFVHYSTPKQMVDDLRKLILRKAHKIFKL